jgi:hypothetical protein
MGQAAPPNLALHRTAAAFRFRAALKLLHPIGEGGESMTDPEYSDQLGEGGESITDPQYSDRPRPPEDGYRWRQFLEDQDARPLAWHGTSSVFCGSIRESGLDPNRDRHELEVIDRLLRILPKEGRSSALCSAAAVLSTWTQTTASSKTLCFTFDYVRALRYAVRYRGGETFEHLAVALDCTLRDYFDALPQSDLIWAHAEQRRISELLRTHRPLVLGVRFEHDLFDNQDSLKFLNSRSAFRAAVNGPLFPARVTGHYSPGLTCRGAEFRASKPIPPERIERWNELDEREELLVKQFFSKPGI